MSNLSEEEKKAIEHFKDLNYVKNRTTLDLRYTESEIDNSEILLNYIDRLQKELDKAKKQLDLDYVDNNYVSKDKIRDKVKELEEETKEMFDKYGDMVENKAIRVLKELLEGE